MENLLGLEIHIYAYFYGKMVVRAKGVLKKEEPSQYYVKGCEDTYIMVDDRVWSIDVSEKQRVIRMFNK